MGSHSGCVLWLGEPACRDVSLVGGKVANLSRLAALHPVPPAYCLTTAPFDRAERTGPFLGTRLGLRPELYDELASAYHSLAGLCGVESPAVAVRSSAVDEDGVRASFAGQCETHLNLVGVEAVAEATVRCWKSARSRRATEYRRRRGWALRDVRVAVLVQRLVVADVSAALFSADPVAGDRGEIVINATWGLGESLVGGTVTPDTYVVRKADLAVVSRRVVEKRRMTVAVPGGTREVDAPAFLRERPALTQGQAVELARLGLALEAEMGWPVDLECAHRAGQLHLLQCRPKTALPSETIAAGSRCRR